ncbi:MAG: hypothetical protein HRU19_30475 [Pseudobacteriovorax sp.]|nr:hypothetical protein [Pseudobacteriovorax sp.]
MFAIQHIKFFLFSSLFLLSFSGKAQIRFAVAETSCINTAGTSVFTLKYLLETPYSDLRAFTSTTSLLTPFPFFQRDFNPATLAFNPEMILLSRRGTLKMDNDQIQSVRINDSKCNSGEFISNGPVRQWGIGEFSVDTNFATISAFKLKKLWILGSTDLAEQESAGDDLYQVPTKGVSYSETEGHLPLRT